MTSNYKVNGVWKETIPKINISGVWKTPKVIYKKVAGSWKTFFIQGGVHDKQFNPLDSFSFFNDRVTDTFTQPDGKIIVVGTFTKYNGKMANGIVRLLPNGDIDTVFQTNIGTAATNFGSTRLCSVAVIQTDGKIVVGGAFSSWNGIAAPFIVRLNSDGTRDLSFDSTRSGTGLNTTPNWIIVQPSGKIVIATGSPYFNGTGNNAILCLLSDGSYDSTFKTNLGTGPNDLVFNLMQRSDGKILISGRFTSFNGSPVGRLALLSADGVIDSTFKTNIGTGLSGESKFKSIAIENDGKILVGTGNVQYSSAGANFNGSVPSGAIVRLNPDGTRTDDSVLNANFGSSAYYYKDMQISIGSDGRIMLWYFSRFNGIDGYLFCRNADGTASSTFSTSLGQASLTAPPYCVDKQPDGTWIMGGGFTTINGKIVNRIVRITAEGLTDSTFNPSLVSGASGTVARIAKEQSGTYIVAGTFTSYNGVPVKGHARINADGSITDTDFITNGGTGNPGASNNNVLIQSDGKIILHMNALTFNGVSARWLARLNVNGSLDTTYATAIGTGFGGGASAVELQSNDALLVTGYSFTSFNSITVAGIVRVLSNGSVDTAFNASLGTGLANGTKKFIVVQPDQKILISSDGMVLNGVAVGILFRLLSTGAPDTLFNTSVKNYFNSDVNFAAVQPDGKIVVAGRFGATTGVPKQICRLNADGSLDAAFNTNIGISSSDNVYNGLYLQNDGKIVFTLSLYSATPTFQGVAHKGIVRLNSDGTLDTAFMANAVGPEFKTMIETSNGLALVGGSFTDFDGQVRSGIARIGSGSAA